MYRPVGRLWRLVVDSLAMMPNNSYKFILSSVPRNYKSVLSSLVLLLLLSLRLFINRCNERIPAFWSRPFQIRGSVGRKISHFAKSSNQVIWTLVQSIPALLEMWGLFAKFHTECPRLSLSTILTLFAKHHPLSENMPHPVAPHKSRKKSRK